MIDLRKYGRAVKRGPFTLPPEIGAADLGDALELECGGYVFRWRRGEAAMLWWKRYLLVMPASARRGELSDPGKLSAASRVYERWARGRRARVGSIYRPSLDAACVRSFGRADRIDYRSDKFNSRGKHVEYTHALRPGDRAWAWVRGQSYLFAIAGPTLRITRDGIEG